MIIFEGTDYVYETFVYFDEGDVPTSTYLMGTVHFPPNPLGINYIEGLLGKITSEEAIKYGDIEEHLISSMSFKEIHKICFQNGDEIYSDLTRLKEGLITNPIISD